jgi:type II secretory pathway pseudopilin PulG
MQYNRNSISPAFTYLEILVCLILVGIIITTARLSASNQFESRRHEKIITEVQHSLDAALMAQLSHNRNIVNNAELKSDCIPNSIPVGYGGIVMPHTINCDGLSLQISTLGEVMYFDE